MRTRLRPLEPPPGRPDPAAQRVIDAIRAYVRDESIPPELRAVGSRHIAAVAPQLHDEAVVHAHDAGATWVQLGTLLGIAAPTVPGARRRHRELLAARTEETG